jgi:hypothetical protein
MESTTGFTPEIQHVILAEMEWRLKSTIIGKTEPS